MSRLNYSFGQIIALLLFVHGVIDNMTKISGRPLDEEDPDEESPEENILCPPMKPGEIIRQPWDDNEAAQYLPSLPSFSGSTNSSIQNFNFSTNAASASDCFDDTGVVIKILINQKIPCIKNVSGFSLSSDCV